MTRTEERLRDAFTAATATVTEESLGPVVVPGPRHRTYRWVAPLATAAALTLVIGLGAVVAGKVRHDRVAPSVSGGPRFVMAVEEGGGATVREAATWRVTARFARPATGPYVAVTNSDPGNFTLAAAEGECKTRLYAVKVGPDGTAERKTIAGGLVPVGGVDGRTGLAAISDGTKIALADGCKNGRIAVFQASARLRIWTFPKADQPITSLTFAPDGRTLGFIHDGRLRVFDSDAPGTDLAGARVLRSTDYPGGGTIDGFAFNPDGRTVTATVQGAKSGPDDHADYMITRLSATTGDPTGRTSPLPQGSWLVRVDATGDHILLIIDRRPARSDSGRFSWMTRADDSVSVSW